jgi:hypothetical protein
MRRAAPGENSAGAGTLQRTVSTTRDALQKGNVPVALGQPVVFWQRYAAEAPKDRAGEKIARPYAGR